MVCGIFNLSDCIMDRFGSFILSIVNAPLIPLLSAIKMLITLPADTGLFFPLWQAIVYVVSTMYGLFIMGAGFNFIISGYNVERREWAKEWLQNTVLMIFCVQASFLIYSAMAEISAGMTAGIVNLIDPTFFLITLDDPASLGLQITLGFAYLIVLFITVIIFSIIYLLASIGVLFAPFGSFFYFIPPLRDIGRFILSMSLFVLFLPFFGSLIILGSSVLLKTTGLSGIKLILVMGAFVLVNILTILASILAVVRAVMGVLNSGIGRSIMFLKGSVLSAIAPKQPEQPSGREQWGKPRYDQPRFDRRYGK